MPFFDHFEILAPYYERFIKLRPPDRLIADLQLPVSGALLDAGGGTGRVSGALAGYASQIVVADLSRGMLTQAGHKQNLQPVNSHTEWLPFADQYFERIIMVDAFHHVCDQEKTAVELWRVLKTGGILLIEEPDIRKASIKVVALLEKLALMRSHFMSPPDICHLFSYPNAQTHIGTEDYNASVIVTKL